MVPALFYAMAFAAAAFFTAGIALLAFDLLFRRRLGLSARVDSQMRKERSQQTAQVLVQHLDDGQPPALAKRTADFARRLLEQADLSLPLSTLWFSCAAAAVAGAAAAFWMTGTALAAPLGAAAGGIAPLAVVWLRRHARLRRIRSQLPDAFDAISRSVRGGHSVQAAMQTVADDHSAPLAQLFGRCCEELNLGASPRTALFRLAAGSGVMELQLFAVAILVQSRSGGNLIELLANLSQMVRRRIRFDRRLKALTGEGRMQANILMVMPAAAIGALLYLAPDYAASLFERPWVLVGAGIMQVTGYAWIKHIIRSDY